MLVELGVVKQPYQAVLEVLNEAVSVSEVAARSGVSRQSVHRWLRRYAAEGLAGQAVGTIPGHGVVADGCGGWGDAGRWVDGQHRAGDRCPLEVLCVGVGGASGDGPSGV